MSRLASELLAHALGNESGGKPPGLEWRAAPMRALIDLRDKQALHRALDGR
jgi:hypothetical protein